MLELAELSKNLRSTTLFAGVPDDALDAVGNRMEIHRLPAGNTHFTEGERADGLYLIVEGTVEIWSAAVEIAERRARECVEE